MNERRSVDKLKKRMIRIGFYGLRSIRKSVSKYKRVVAEKDFYFKLLKIFLSRRRVNLEFYIDLEGIKNNYELMIIFQIHIREGRRIIQKIFLTF